MTTKIEENAAAPATATDEQPKAVKKASRAPQGAQVAKKKGKSGKKTSPAKKAPKGQKKPAVRDGSKTERGFISGTLGKKMGLTVASVKGEDGERRYSIKG